MADLENNFNSNDFSLISPQGNADGTFGNQRDYLRLIVRNQNGDIVFYPKVESDGSVTNQEAIFYSTVPSAYTYNDGSVDVPSYFKIQTPGIVDGVENRDITFEDGNLQFQTYVNDLTQEIYVKPNEILSSSRIAEGNYELQFDFLNQFPISPVGLDIQHQESVDRFIIKEISPSRKEVRIKLLDLNINETNTETDIKNNIFNILGSPYEFNHVLNIGLGRHIPITNYVFDKVSTGDTNQSLVLKLYEPLPNNVSTLQLITIEKEVLVTQTQDIYYFSEVTEVVYGPGLTPDTYYNLPEQEEFVDFQNFDQLTSSLSTEVINSVYTGSTFDYPNVNTDFNEFENHTFFGSAKTKLENFRKKVQTIQSNLSIISSSLTGSTAKIQSTEEATDSNDLIELRNTSFDKMQQEIDSFTPYERFLYYDGQSRTTASAPGLGENYVGTYAINKDLRVLDNVVKTNESRYYSKYSGLPNTYRITQSATHNDTRTFITLNKYRVEDKPFFNYSGSVYLSFVAKGDFGTNRAHSKLILEGSVPDHRPNHTVPGNTRFSDIILGKSTRALAQSTATPMTSSLYKRYIFKASSSHWTPSSVVDFDTGNIGDFNATTTEVTPLHTHIKTGSTPIQVDGRYQHLSTVTTGSGVLFSGSIMPAGDLFRLYIAGNANGTAVSSSFISDIKVTLKNPTNVQPFGQLPHTSSTDWTNWYNGMLDSASAFDTDNIHSLENNLPTYIQESLEYDDVKQFLSMTGEQFDLIRNHIDAYTNFHNRDYDKLESVPPNLIPMILSNLGWDSIIPFSSSMASYFGPYLSSVVNESDISQNTSRKVLNNLIYLYKSKGTKNSIRGLLNTYGYPPDVLTMNEFGGSNEPQNGVAVTSSNPTIGTTTNETNLRTTPGNISFTTRQHKFYHYNVNKKSDRNLNLDWWMDNANANTIQFVYKHKKPTLNQTILKSSGSGNETLWDLRLKPSANALSSSFEFRLNNSQTGSLAIATNAVSMSTGFLNIRGGQLWNVMLQRMSSSVSGAGTQEYRLHTALQEQDRIKTYGYITMSISGGVSTDGNHRANQNFIGSGSRHQDSSSNLFVGNSMSGSLAEIRTWTTTLSSSKFRLHTLNKLSTVGNNIDAHRNELIYHFKLNENYSTSSISSSAQTLINIVDANPNGPSSTPTDYTFTKSSNIATSSLLYGYDSITLNTIGLQDAGQSLQNDNKIIVKPNRVFRSNLTPFKSSVDNLYDIQESRGKRTNSNKLEINRSPQDFVNNFILDKIQSFNLETLYGNPVDLYSASFGELDTFKTTFFDKHKIKVDINKFVRGSENLINQSLVDRIKKSVPAKSTLSDTNAGAGVTIKPTVLEKSKYEYKPTTFETNPNTANGLINVGSLTGSAISQSGEVIFPRSSSIDLLTEITFFTGSSVILPRSSSINIINTSYVITESSVTLPISGSISFIEKKQALEPVDLNLQQKKQASSGVATLTFIQSASNDSTITLTSFDGGVAGTTKTYLASTSSINGALSGSFVLFSTGSGTATGAGSASVVGNLAAAITSSNGHGTKFTIVNTNTNDGVLVISQSVTGTGGNKSIVYNDTITSSLSSTPNFTNGVDAVKQYFTLERGGFDLTDSAVLPIRTGSITMYTSSNFLTGSELTLPFSSSIAIPPSTTGSSVEFPISGTNNFISTNNIAKFVDNHKDWGTTSNDTQFIMYSNGPGGRGASLDDNVLHIDKRYTFHLIGDVETYSGSKTNHTDFSNFRNFFNRTQLTDGIHADATYESFMNDANLVTNGLQTGRALGKTRFFHTASNGEITLPSNHVSKFNNPWTDRMYQGSQNTQPGQLPVSNYEDLTTASFYRVKITGGENQIIVKSGKSKGLDNDDRIIY